MSPRNSRPFQQLFREHAREVGRTLRNLGVPSADLPGVLEETFLLVHRRLPSFRGASSLRTWIYGIAVRVAAEHRKAPEVESDASELGPLSRRAPQAEAERRQTLAKLDAALAELDDGRRSALVLYEVEELTLAEIAVATGAQVPAVYAALAAARRDLAATFHEGSPADEEDAARTGQDPPRLARGGEGVPEGLSCALRAARGRRVSEGMISDVAVRLPPEMPAPAEGRPDSPPFERAAARRSAGDDDGGRQSPRSHAPMSPRTGARAPARARPGTQAARTPAIWQGILAGAGLGAVVGAASLFVPLPPEEAAVAMSTPTSAQHVFVSEAAGGTAASAAPAEVEAEYLRRARARLRASPAEALALAEAHPQRYPDGVLGEEREVIAVAALAALGRKVEARARARLLLLLFPGSPHRRELEALVPDLDRAPETPPP